MMSPISRSVENYMTQLSWLLAFFAVLVVPLSIEVNFLIDAFVDV